MENKDGYNPLQLAAKFGQHEIFIFIMNRDVRSFYYFQTDVAKKRVVLKEDRQKLGSAAMHVIISSNPYGLSN